MKLRRATSWDYAIAGELTVEAYAEFTAGPKDPYIAHLRDAATRDREAELWVATPDDRDDLVLGTVTICPIGSPWRELAGEDEGEFRMLAVAAVRPRARHRRGAGQALPRPLPRRRRRLGGDLDADGDDRWRTGSTSGSASCAHPSWTGSRTTAST